MSRIAALLLILSSCGDAGAGAGDDVTDLRFTPPEAPAAGLGLQFRMPDTDIPAGEERQLCWTPDWVPERDYFAVKLATYQSKMGHHVVALRSQIPRQPGQVFDCTSVESMATVGPLLTADELWKDGQMQTVDNLPDGFAVRVPADSVIVFQSHYVNVTQKPIRISDVANIYWVDDGASYVEANYHVVPHMALAVPPGLSTWSMHCDFTEQVDFLLLFGHMHERGTRISIERIINTTPEVLYDQDNWSPTYRDTPPTSNYHPDTPLTFMPGDRMRVTCHYDNRTGQTLGFPSEMCVSFGTYFPAKPAGFLVCDAAYE